MPSKDKTEARERLEAMYADDGGTWDLSPNDKTAIRKALDSIELDLAIDSLCEDLPIGYQVLVTLEAGSGTIELSSPTGCVIADDDDLLSESFADNLSDALEIAKTC